jgi:peptidoglycan/LPS O-acetylase OafA/YrhL
VSALISATAGPRHGQDVQRSGAPAALARARTFHTLDALRGVAALSVVLFHCAFIYGIAPPAEGQIAVDLFFVMSGFIIAYRYDADLAAGLTVARFTRLRLIRLYPLFFLGSVLGALPAAMAIASGHGDGFHAELVESFPLAIFMLPSHLAAPRMGELYPLNYVAWSLALEIIVNIAYAATHRFWTTRRLVVAIAAGFLGLVGCAIAYGTLSIGFDWANAPGGCVRILFGFAMGVLIFRLASRERGAFTPPWWVLLVVASLVFFVDPAKVCGAAWFKPLWELVAVSVVVPAIVVAAIRTEPPREVQGACALAGLFSYVLYSLHVPFVGFFLRGEDRLHLGTRVQSSSEALVFTILLVALCVVAHAAYDKPVRRGLSRFRSGTR